MRLLLIEDEYPAAERLRRLVARVEPTADVVGVLDSVEAGVKWFAAHPAPDLILSDIQLADGLSFELLERVALTSPVIFTTSYDEYALRAFKVHSLDYLLKPIKEAELATALAKYRTLRELGAAGADATAAHLTRIERLLDSLPDRAPVVGAAAPRTVHKSRFLVRHREQLLPIPVAEVAFLHAQHEQVWLTTTSGKRHPIDYTLEQAEKLLDPARFFRLNRQVLATAEAIQRIDLHFNGKLKLTLRPELPEEVLVSREKAGTFRAWLEQGQ